MVHSVDFVIGHDQKDTFDPNTVYKQMTDENI